MDQLSSRHLNFILVGCIQTALPIVSPMSGPEAAPSPLTDNVLEMPMRRMPLQSKPLRSTTRQYRLTLVAFALMVGLTFAAAPGLAGDDPSIQGKLRQDIQSSMQHFIAHQTVDGTFVHYDPVDGKLLHLSRPNLHAGIVKKGDFYVSCADFVDQDGRKIDVDFLVVDAAGALRTTQALVHKIDGAKRPYDVESE